MDIIMSVVSIMKDMSSVDKEYKNLNLQLKYTLDKASRILDKFDKDENKIGLVVVRTRMKEGELLSKKLDELLNTQSIAIKDKIRLSLPINQTKTQIIDVIETLERVVNDLKQEISGGSLNEMKEIKNEPKDGCGIKRKVSDTNMTVNQTIKPIKNQLTVQQIDQHIEEVYEMGPTLREDQYHISESKHKQRELEFKISICSTPQIMKILQAQNLAQTKTKMSQKNVPKEHIIYTVARINFQKCYPKIKSLTKDIDRISTKAHFHFVFQKMGQLNNSGQISRPSSNMKKNIKQRVSDSQKQQQQIFFSFPQEQRGVHNFEFRILVKKQDANKTLYRVSNDEWVKVDQAQFEIFDGEKLAAFLSPETKQPSIYFQINYNLSH